MAACCAGAESGHAAAPPTSVMNSRRLIVAPRGQHHAPHRLTVVRVLERGERGANCDQLFWAGNVGFESHDRGQNRKSSKSANVFQFAPESGPTPDLKTTSPASASRTPPSRPRASASSRARRSTSDESE